MTSPEQDAVRRAWEADPESLPGDFTLPMEDCTEAEIRDAVHRRLLELGAWVEPVEDAFVVIATHGEDNGFTHEVAGSTSLIEAMALGVVALASKEVEGG